MAAGMGPVGGDRGGRSRPPQAPPSASGRAVFLDRDGTLIRNQHYGCDPDAIEWLDGVVEGLRRLRSEGYRLVVVTNQSGVARGLFTEEQVDRLHRRMDEMLASVGLSVDGYYYCPHHPAGTVREFAVRCECRKPQPGMLLRACAELGIDPRRSWMIGDIIDDVEAGHRTGCRAILIGHGTDGASEAAERTPEYVARDFGEAAAYLLGNPARSTAADAWRKPAQRLGRKPPLTPTGHDGSPSTRESPVGAGGVLGEPAYLTDELEADVG